MENLKLTSRVPVSERDAQKNEVEFYMNQASLKILGIETFQDLFFYSRADILAFEQKNITDEILNRLQTYFWKIFPDKSIDSAMVLKYKLSPQGKSLFDFSLEELGLTTTLRSHLVTLLDVKSNQQPIFLKLIQFIKKEGRVANIKKMRFGLVMKNELTDVLRNCFAMDEFCNTDVDAVRQYQLYLEQSDLEQNTHGESNSNEYLALKLKYQLLVSGIKKSNVSLIELVGDKYFQTEQTLEEVMEKIPDNILEAEMVRRRYWLSTIEEMDALAQQLESCAESAKIKN